MPLPAVLTIQSGINKLRYATLMGIKKAKTKEVKRSLRPNWAWRRRPRIHRRVYLPERTKQTQFDRRQRPGSRGQAGGGNCGSGARYMSGILIVMEQRRGMHRMSWRR